MLTYSLIKAIKGYEAADGLDADTIKIRYEAVAGELLSDFD